MRTFAMTLVAGLALSASPGWAASETGGTMTITAHVPAVCSISANGFVLNEAGMLSGTVQEFCNSSTGYQIMASHRPLVSGETAYVRYGSTDAPLGVEGLSPIVFRSGQRFDYVPVQVSAPHLSAPLAVAFVMSPV